MCLLLNEKINRHFLKWSFQAVCTKTSIASLNGHADYNKFWDTSYQCTNANSPARRKPDWSFTLKQASKSSHLAGAEPLCKCQPGRAARGQERAVPLGPFCSVNPRMVCRGDCVFSFCKQRQISKDEASWLGMLCRLTRWGGSAVSALAQPVSALCTELCTLVKRPWTETSQEQRTIHGWH